MGPNDNSLPDDDETREWESAHEERHRPFGYEIRDQRLTIGGRIEPPQNWNTGRNQGPPERDLPAAGPKQVSLKEWILPWPSAPIFGTNRLIEHQLELPASKQQFHTYRVLAHAGYKRTAKHIYLLHHGLNERTDLGFFYDLASHILSGEDGENSLCIVRPFPGHLTRFPYGEHFSQTPLDRYLTDAGDLFRQFLRYMLETRWLLSAIAPLDNYHTVIGADLLCSPSSQENETRSRSDAGDIASALVEEWNRCSLASSQALDRQRLTNLAIEPDVIGLEDVRGAIDALRGLVSRKVRTAAGTTPEEVEKDIRDAPPSVHVLGYSLGGFVAQSVLFSWPYLVGGCTTLLSGGALRRLTPTAFAHPEEWQTVLHALRYEMDATLLERRVLGSDGEPKADGTPGDLGSAGLDPKLFEFFVRVFYSVFEQEFGSAYKSRVAEFSRRLLFVVGGSDQIVRTQSVLDAAPEQEGINLLQIANLSHFLGRDAKGVEEEQRKYWVPEIANIARRFSDEAERVRQRELVAAWLSAEWTEPWPDALTRAQVGSAPSADQAALPSPQFEKTLDLMMGRWLGSETFEEVEKRDSDIDEANGILLMAQNMIPAVVLAPLSRRERAAALHHSDDAVMGYLAGLRRRSQALRRTRSLSSWGAIVPAAAGRWHSERSARHPSRSESVPGMLGGARSRTEEWIAVQEFCGDSLRYFYPSDFTQAEARPEPAAAAALEAAWESWNGTSEPAEPVTVLPDAWVWVSKGALEAAGVDSGGSAYQQFSDFIGSIAGPSGLTLLSDWLSRGDLMCVGVSSAHFNPRFRGRLVTRPEKVREVLVHVALSSALSHSEPLGDRTA